MKDRKFLMWLHERLIQIHGESETVDYMGKLRAIIKSIDPDVCTPNVMLCNSLEDLRKIIISESIVKKFRMEHLFFDDCTEFFCEKTPPSWLVSKLYNWWFTDHVLKLKVGGSINSDFHKITRIE